MAKKKNSIDDLVSIALNRAIKRTVSEIHKKIEDAYEFAIESFYNDYEPKYYERTYGLYYASTGFRDMYTKSIINPYPDRISKGYLYSKKNNAYIAGIIVDFNNIPWDYKDDKGYVFDRSFKGIHGTKNIKVMEPSPLHIMNEKFKEITLEKNMDAVMNRNLVEELNRAFS